MQPEECKFKGRGNLDLFYQCWFPASEPRAVLIVINGLADHSGRYANLANYFAAEGYAVYSYDHRGHGKSDGLRCFVERFSDFQADLKTFVDIVRAGNGNARIFIIGHSMGATITLSHAVLHQGDLTGLLLSATSLKIGRAVSPVLIALAGILSFLAPKMGTTVLDAAAISRDRSVVEAYVNDPLVYRCRIPARLGAELIKTMRQLPDRIPEINLPMLVMHGSADRLSDPEGSRLLYHLAGSSDKTLKIYPGCYHEIFNEPMREQVFQDMKIWLSARV